MAWTLAAERGTDRLRSHAFDDQFANHAHKARMGSSGAGSLIGEP